MIPTSVTVKHFPTNVTRAESKRFLRQFKAELADCYRPQMIFDFSGVDHITSEGIDLLLRCVTLIAERDGELKMAGATEQTALVLELTQMSEVIESFDSVDDALASWDVVGAPVPGTEVQETAAAPPARAA